ncbi:MAG TPA: tetratricopeptide repeat protein [Gemmatimonadaceae bacterium]|jgi:predicted Zn-dependent protease
MMTPLALPRRTFVVMMAAACAAAASACRSPAPARQPTAASVPSLTEREIRERDIEFYKARADRDPTGAADLAHLGALYLERARDTGDPRDALLAEQVARRSMRNREPHNMAAHQILSSSLLSQHRFDEALVEAKHVRDSDPSSAPARAGVAEIEMELGRYDSASVGFASLDGAQNDLAVAPRLARWSEIRGHTDAARRYMRGALSVAQHEPTLPREQLAWFWLRSGDIELRAENLAGADSAYRAGLSANPGDYRVLAAMARLAMARHQFGDAAKYGEESIATMLDPATLGILSDAYGALGDTARAADYARVLDVAVSKQPGAYHRAWSLFLLDHNQRVDVVARKIREEMKTRRDIYAYDLLAWSLHKQGRDVQAQAAMATALSQGTRDPLLVQHEAAITAALSKAGTAAHNTEMAK